MNRGLFREVLLVLAPAAAVVAGFAAIDHHQRLAEEGYRVGALRARKEALTRDVENRRSRVGTLISPVRLLREARSLGLPLDYPRHWNEVEGNGEARRLVAGRAPVPGTGGKGPAGRSRP